MKIGLDVMGGDFAPDIVVEGAVDTLVHLSGNDRIVLIGDKNAILKKLGELSIDPSNFDIVHASQTIEMGEHPARAFSQKKNSSIAIGYNMLKNKLIDGFCSAGNTGAMLVGLSYSVNVIPGVLRPALVTNIPSLSGKFSVLLDVGLNTHCKPDVLHQYGKLGRIYAHYILGIKNPTIALLNIGAEESKGTSAVRTAYELMKKDSSLNFVGNIEGNHLFHNDMADVIVCDGFVGNIVLKEAEAFYSIYRMRNLSDLFFDLLNFENIGGTPIIGINTNVVIGHGHSSRKAIMNMVLQTKAVVEAGLALKIIEEI